MRKYLIPRCYCNIWCKKVNVLSHHISLFLIKCFRTHYSHGRNQITFLFVEQHRQIAYDLSTKLNGFDVMHLSQYQCMHRIDFEYTYKYSFQCMFVFYICCSQRKNVNCMLVQGQQINNALFGHSKHQSECFVFVYMKASFYKE